MLSGYKTFSTFDSPQKPFSFVCVNSVLDVFTVRKQFKIIQPVISAVQIFMVNLHTFRNRAVKRFPHRSVNSDFGILSIFTRTETDVVIPRHMSFDRACAAITHPRFTVFDIKSRRNACAKKSSHISQRGASLKHSFSFIDLRRGKQFSPRHASDTRKIANFVKALIAADWFPNLHTVNIKPVYVGGQQ